MDIEAILEMYEDDYNPSSKVPGPRNMYAGGQLVQPNADGSRPGYSGENYNKDKTALDADTIKKIKKKIKLKPGQKWNFYNPETNPTGHTYGIKKSDNVKLYDVARNIGKEGRAETKLKKATEKYQEIKANPKKLAEKKSIDKERYLANREEILENSRLKYETDKQWRKAKLEYERIQKIENPEKYKKKMSDWYAKRGKFPPGNNYKENVWHDMFRSSQKQGQTRFLLVDENGNQLTQDKFPKVDGKVRWDKNANYKNVKFYDTVTKQFVKLDNSIKGKGITFEKYLNQKSVGGKGAYENAINGYRNKDTIKNITFKDSKGKNIRIGTVMRDKLVQDNNNFIKSGINVQHPDIDNAFWKNEISTTSSNNKLNNLETILKRELRNAGDNTMLRNKALTNFKTEINKLPGGITKVIEGITYGNAPSTESVVAQVGKDFKIDRFKDFPKTNKQVQNAMLEFAGTITNKCKIGNAEGGRIGFASGSADCLRIAKEGLEKGLKNGFPKNQQGDLARKILSSGKFLKDAVSLRGLFGPAALAFTAAAEAGIVGYDMLSSGKSFREAVGDSIFNYALGDKTKIDSEEEFIKRLKNIKTGPSGLRDFSDQEIGKMLNFKTNLDDMQKGFSLYNQLQDVDQAILDNRASQDGTQMFPDNAFQLDAEKDRIQADIRDYNKVGTPRKVTDYFLSDAATEGADAAKKAELLARQDQLQDAGIGKIYQSAIGDEKRKKEAADIKFQLEQMYNPTKLDEFGEYFISRPQSEQSYIMGLGYKEGGIANLNVNKK